MIAVTRHGAWAEIRLNRPDKRNAVSRALADAAIDALATLAAEQIAIAVMSAEGPVFSAGADISEGLTEDAPLLRLIESVRSSPLLIVGKVARPVFGGAVSLVAACPVVFCADDAYFMLPEARHGIFPVDVLRDLEPFLPRRALLDLALTGAALSAQEARAQGLVSRVSAAENLDRDVDGWVADALKQPALLSEARQYFAHLFTREPSPEGRES